MKNLLVMGLVLALLGLVANPLSAQGKMALGIGGDVLLPMGDFKEGVSTGFGGSARLQYEVAPMFAVGGTLGYFTWGAKDITSHGITVTGATFKGIPVRAFGKYYFMPEGPARVYGIAELGMFFGSAGDVTIPAYTIGGVTVPARTVSGESTTKFNYAPGLGVEIPIGTGKTTMDISGRWDAIATDPSANSVGVRVGVNFPIGQ